MAALIFVLVFAVLLFLLPFSTKRRFGILGLALGAGYIISTNWADTVTPFIEQQGIVLVSPPLSAVVASALVLLPPVLLLFSGPKNSNTTTRIIGSAAFAVLALIFLLEPLSLGLALDEQAAQAIETIQDWQGVAMVVGLVAAIADILLYKPPKDKDQKK